MMIVTAVSASVHIDRIKVATADARLSMSFFTLSLLSKSPCSVVSRWLHNATY